MNNYQHHTAPCGSGFTREEATAVHGKGFALVRG